LAIALVLAIVASAAACVAPAQLALEEPAPSAASSAEASDEADAIGGSSTPHPPVIESFVASPETVDPGESATLIWDVLGATTVTIHPAIDSTESSSVAHGVEQIWPTATTTYTLTATNEAGSSTRSTTVAVASADETVVGYDPVSGRNQEIDFTWEQLCLSSQYQVQIAKDPGFTLIVFDSGAYAPASGTSPALGYPAGGAIASPAQAGSAIASGPTLEAGHTYYWRVRMRQSATGQMILSPWSVVRSFTVKSGLPATSAYYGVQLLHPNNGCTSYPVSPVSFSWSPSKETTKYRFVLAEDAGLANVIADTEAATTAYQHEGMLAYGASYFWRVMPLEPAPGDWSATFSFQTEAAPAPEPTPMPPPATPLWAWILISVGSILVIATLVCIFTVRRA